MYYPYFEGGNISICLGKHKVATRTTEQPGEKHNINTKYFINIMLLHSLLPGHTTTAAKKFRLLQCQQNLYVEPVALT